MGIDRLKEALEANPWDGPSDFEDDIDPEDFENDDDDEVEGSVGFGIEAAEMEREMAGMKRAIYGGGEGMDDENDGDEGVEQLQAMMLKMQAVRGGYSPVNFYCDANHTLDLGADMPEAERKKFAAKAVNDILKTL